MTTKLRPSYVFEHTRFYVYFKNSMKPEFCHRILPSNFAEFIVYFNSNNFWPILQVFRSIYCLKMFRSRNWVFPNQNNIRTTAINIRLDYVNIIITKMGYQILAGWSPDSLNRKILLQAYYHANYTQHIKNLEWSELILTMKFLHGRVLWKFLKWQFRKF